MKNEVKKSFQKAVKKSGSKTKTDKLKSKHKSKIAAKKSAAKTASGAKTGSKIKKTPPAKNKNRPIGKKAKPRLKNKASKKNKRPKKSPVKQVEVQLPHGQDMHFIPAHKKEVYLPVQNGLNSEKLFHTKEEVALHQENQKVKADMASRMGRKRIFKMLGR